MSQSNPFSKYVTNPSNIPDPNKINLQQLEKYNSLEIEKLGSLFRSVKRSGLYIGGVVGLCLVAAWWGEKQARCDLFGKDSTKLLIQIREEDIWTLPLSEMNNTTPTTENSKECSTLLKDSSRTPPSTAINFSMI